MIGDAETRDMTGHIEPPGDQDLARPAGDGQAFLALYDRYVASVERYIAARTDSSYVEDLVSTTFTRAFASFHTYQARRGSFAAWLFTIAHNAVVDHYRERAHVVSLEPSWSMATPEPGPEALALTSEERQQMRAALADLTEDQRDALALRYAADLPFAAVARALGKTEPAAKMLVQRGLGALRRQFEKEQSYDHDE